MVKISRRNKRCTGGKMASKVMVKLPVAPFGQVSVLFANSEVVSNAFQFIGVIIVVARFIAIA